MDSARVVALSYTPDLDLYIFRLDTGGVGVQMLSVTAWFSEKEITRLQAMIKGQKMLRNEAKEE